MMKMKMILTQEKEMKEKENIEAELKKDIE